MNILEAAKRMFLTMYTDRNFQAEVVSTSGNKITVKRLGSTVNEGPFPAAAGLAAAVSPGDIVKVERVGSSFIVSYEITV